MLKNKTNMKNTLKQLPVTLALTAGAGILLHDTNLDVAASAAIQRDIGGSGLSSVFKSDNSHSHIERPVTKQGGEPRSQSRLSDEKKYIISKRLMGNNNDLDYIWPSV
jgi:hypothetical protein